MKEHSPKRLVPNHLEQGQEEGQSNVAENSSESKSATRRFIERHERLDSAPSLESALTKKLEELGLEYKIAENINPALVAIEDFRRDVKEAQALRKGVQSLTKKIESSKSDNKKVMMEELGLMAKRYIEKKQAVKDYLSLGPSFEQAYREYLREKNEFAKFAAGRRRIAQLERTLIRPSISGLDNPSDKFGVVEQSLLESSVSKTEGTDYTEEDELEALATIFDPESKDFEDLRETLVPLKMAGAPKTKIETEKEIARLKQETLELWDNPMVRYFWAKKDIEKMLEDFAEGEAVLELPSTMRVLNALDEWETMHQRTTVGGVLVGPPGVGKTTIIRHYLESKGRGYSYIDLSAEVTRYMLFGQKDVRLKSPSEEYHRLLDDMKGLGEDDFRKYVEENAGIVAKITNLPVDEARIGVLKEIEKRLKDGAPLAEGEPAKKKEISDELDKIKDRVLELIAKTYRKELATEFSHIIERNGWRDGFIIAALRRGDSVILDEFVRYKDWDALYSLMEQEPGGTWSFGDNAEKIPIPKDWRMYFTANIGKRHGSAKVAEALASRAGGKVIGVGYPPESEEIRVGLASIANPAGDIVRSEGAMADDMAKMFILIHNVFPNVRKYLETSQSGSVPISYRTLRNLGEKLVIAKDKDTGRPVYQATKKTFDEALFETLIEPQADLYADDQVTPKNIVEQATMVGLLLDDSIKDQIVPKYLPEDEWKKRKEAHEGIGKTYKEIVKEIQGLARGSTLSASYAMESGTPLPPQRNF